MSKEMKKAHWMRSMALSCAALMGALGVSSCVTTEYQDSFGRAYKIKQTGITLEGLTNFAGTVGGIMVDVNDTNAWKEVHQPRPLVVVQKNNRGKAKPIGGGARLIKKSNPKRCHSSGARRIRQK